MQSSVPWYGFLLALVLGASSARALEITYYVVPSEVSVSADLRIGDLRLFVPATGTNTTGGTIDVDFDAATQSMRFTGGGGVTLSDLSVGGTTPSFSPGVNGAAGSAPAGLPLRLEGGVSVIVGVGLANTSIDAALRDLMLVPRSGPAPIDPSSGAFSLLGVDYRGGASRIDLRGTTTIATNPILYPILLPALTILLNNLESELAADPEFHDVVLDVNGRPLRTEIDVFASGGYDLANEGFAASSIAGEGTITGIDFGVPGILAGGSTLTLPFTTTGQVDIDVPFLGQRITGTYTTSGTILAFAVPEPGPVVLLSIGLAGLAAASRRRAR